MKPSLSLILLACGFMLAPLSLSAQDQPNGSDDSTIRSADATNTVALKRIWRTMVASAGGKQLSVTAASYTSGTTIAAGSRGLVVLFSSNFAGTVQGYAYTGDRDAAQSLRPSGNDTLGAIVITCTAGSPGPTGSPGVKGDTGATGPAGQNATTTATATSSTAGLMPAAAVAQLAALPTIVRASVSATVPTLVVAGTTTVTLSVPGAVVGGVVTVNCADATLNGSIVLPLTPVTTAGQVSVTLKAVVAITAGSRTFNVAVINP